MASTALDTDAANGVYTYTWVSDPSYFIVLSDTVMSNYTSILQFYTGEHQGLAQVGFTWGQYFCLNTTVDKPAFSYFANRVVASVYHFGDIMTAHTALGRRLGRFYTAPVPSATRA